MNRHLLFALDGDLRPVLEDLTVDGAFLLASRLGQDIRGHTVVVVAIARRLLDRAPVQPEMLAQAITLSGVLGPEATETADFLAAVAGALCSDLEALVPVVLDCGISEEFGQGTLRTFRRTRGAFATG